MAATDPEPNSLDTLMAEPSSPSTLPQNYSLHLITDDGLPKYDAIIPPQPFATSSSGRSFVLTLSHCAPGNINKRNKVLSGKTIEIITEAITLIPTTSYRQLVLHCLQRVDKRFEIKVQPGCGQKLGGGFAVCTGGEDREAEITVQDEEGWRAARALMWEKPEAKVRFVFALIPDAYRETKVEEKEARVEKVSEKEVKGKAKKAKKVKCVVM
ncbi:hypothetical protein BAUCODRAFT_470891 [Baudoinia panamericana UAMH 10762]|uniref:Uncharacterized protein n=1 Tax=Baudoinia panamericana (strain UAMH 10762) TaxID=717646 RepID=M2MXQ1_BAUPA|nr:uncharacterized protein BAUCODRAFT_470891 [Baudoinia panamericana UAMH 10762]EMC96348.1 hypothetical protein BAUCODRAFT_470891 [Baudoinia panamericana UAMH 10762]